MRPRIAKTADRIPFPAGTKVAYWNWISATEALPTHYTGITQVLTSDDVATMTDMGGQRPAQVGEEVICLTNESGDLTNQYERIHHIGPMGDDEPQRWFPVGVDPNIQPEQATT